MSSFIAGAMRFVPEHRMPVGDNWGCSNDFTNVTQSKPVPAILA